MGIVLSDELRARVISMICPTEKEIKKQSRVIEELSTALAAKATEIGQHYSFIEPQGSTGRKQTQLRGAADIDLFVGLNPEDYPFIRAPSREKSRGALDNLMDSLVDDWFIPATSGLSVRTVQKTYSQHPYLSLEMDGLEVDILACFDLTPEDLQDQGPVTAVDRTVHHTAYVADRITPRIRDTVRILKSFVRACHAYGDRCAVGQMGLTGVSLELIAILEKDLGSCLERIHELDRNPIDPRGRDLSELRKAASFKDDYVILIDPTDTTRNVASSFTPRAYRWVKHRIAELWRAVDSMQEDRIYELLIESDIPTNPIPPPTVAHSFAFEYLSEGGMHYTVVRDKLYSLARKIEARMKRERTGETRFGEVLSEVYFEGDRYAIGFLVEQPSIERVYKRRGPPADLDDAVDKFRRAHSDVEERDGFLWSTETRQWTNAAAMIDHLLKENHVDGLRMLEDRGGVTAKVLNVLVRYVLEIEPAFKRRITAIKGSAS